MSVVHNRADGGGVCTSAMQGLMVMCVSDVVSLMWGRLTITLFIECSCGIWHHQDIPSVFLTLLHSYFV